jgi:hypothetical protein
LLGHRCLSELLVGSYWKCCELLWLSHRWRTWSLLGVWVVHCWHWWLSCIWHSLGHRNSWLLHVLTHSRLLVLAHWRRSLDSMLGLRLWFRRNWSLLVVDWCRVVPHFSWVEGRSHLVLMSSLHSIRNRHGWLLRQRSVFRSWCTCKFIWSTSRSTCHWLRSECWASVCRCLLTFLLGWLSFWHW